MRHAVLLFALVIGCGGTVVAGSGGAGSSATSTASGHDGGGGNANTEGSPCYDRAGAPLPDGTKCDGGVCVAGKCQ